eukprot:128701-Hanusia_phi.AAC.2
MKSTLPPLITYPTLPELLEIESTHGMLAGDLARGREEKGGGEEREGRKGEGVVMKEEEERESKDERSRAATTAEGQNCTAGTRIRLGYWQTEECRRKESSFMIDVFCLWGRVFSLNKSHH